ncbi:Hypothetical predicted protein [Pelobates cultripes]|uniref:Uncharacterized protein n=1 Tax=Pelobates cultripes TaxID=61616 RepID=A0AAD1SAE3_PELCU|nr:Hypothetical predicted protein [Pelobates cultripes]
MTYQDLSLSIGQLTNQSQRSGKQSYHNERCDCGNEGLTERYTIVVKHGSPGDETK